jgi:hypothetical protein
VDRKDRFAKPIPDQTAQPWTTVVVMKIKARTLVQDKESGLFSKKG